MSKSMLSKSIPGAAAVLLASLLPASAQWLHYPTAGIPRTVGRRQAQPDRAHAQSRRRQAT